jgi:P27 family predicted phage terminase small subunit
MTATTSPRPPAGLDASGRAAWRRGAAVLVELGEAVELSLEPLGTYARAMSDVAELRRQWAKDGRDGMVLGARGLPVPHPLLGAIEKAERLALEAGGLLGFDPQARRRLSRRVTGAGRPAGAASAADRAAPTRRRLKAVES